MWSGYDSPPPVEVHVGQRQQVGRRRLPTVQHAPLVDVAILQKLITINILTVSLSGALDPSEIATEFIIQVKFAMLPSYRVR